MEQTIADIGKVEAIDTLFRGTRYEHPRKAVFCPEAGATVVTATKVYQEGLDFNLVYFPLPHLGYKCTLGVTGELYASLARPKTLSVVLGVSSRFSFPQIQELWKGILSAAREHGYEAVDLDLVPCPNGLSISLGATGWVSRLTAARRSKARSKDLVCVSGSMGAAYMGFRLLEKGLKEFDRDGTQPDLEKNRMLVAAYLKPELEASVVQRLEDAEIYPSYGYFLTGGLADGLRRLQRDSGLGVKVYADRIPFEGNTFATGKALDIDPVGAAMSGGDDFRLLFTVPILSLEKFRRDFQTFDIIGHLALPEAGCCLVTPDGVEFPVRATGWKDPEE